MSRTTGHRFGNRRTQIGGQFAPHTINMLRSPAWRVLSLSARRVLDRVEIEFADHGGTENGELPVTYDDFEEYGVHRHAIAPAIREAVALGFLQVTEQGRAGNAEYRKPNLFRLTYRHTHNAPPTDDWKLISTDLEATNRAKTARSPRTFSSVGKRQISVSENGTENSNSVERKPPLHASVRKPPPLSISGGGSALSAGVVTPKFQRRGSS